MKRSYAVAVCIFLVLRLFAQEDNRQEFPAYRAVGIFYDQDYTLEMIGLRKLNEDRNYTMGLGLYYSDPSLHHGFLFAPHRFLNRIFQKSFLNEASSIPAIMLANGSFTPDSLPA